MRILRSDSYRSVPWKNGQGTTREILRHPSEGADFLWRLSIAEVGQSGPFSAFPGYQRIIMLLRGDGFVLRFDDGREQDLRKPNAPFRFDGGDAVSCVLEGGASQDLNLMLRNDLICTDCEVLALNGRQILPSVAGGTRLLFCLKEGIRLDYEKSEFREAPERLGRWDTAILLSDETVSLEAELESDAGLFHALIFAPRGPAAVLQTDVR